MLIGSLEIEDIFIFADSMDSCSPNKYIDGHIQSVWYYIRADKSNFEKRVLSNSQSVKYKVSLLLYKIIIHSMQELQ